MPDQLSARVIQVIAKTQHLPVESIAIDQTFADLKIDSLDGMNILFAVESEIGQLSARVIQVIAKTQHLPVESIAIDQTFADLKIDSLDGMNILFAVES